MLLVKYFLGEVYKLRKFLTQIKIKITNKRLGLPTAIKQVIYIRLFLTKRALEWFKPYFIKIQLNITYLYITWPKTLQLRYLTRCLTQSTTSSLATALNRLFFSPTHPPYNVHQIRYLQSYLGLAAGYPIRGTRQDLGQISKVQA